jgi:hypothetical protein
MRSIALFALSAFFFGLAPPVSHAKQARQRCPASAFKASTAIWPLGALHTGETRTARHPCGKMITCVGGSFQPKVLRRCHWDWPMRKRVASFEPTAALGRE